MARNFVASSSHNLVRFLNPPITARPLTIAAWVRPTTLPANAAIVAVENQTNSQGWYLRLDGAGTRVRAQEFDGGSADAVSTGTIGTGTWAHVAGTFNGTTNFVHLNGVAGTGVAARSAPAGVDAMWVGRTDGAVFYWNGDIAEVAIWNAILDASELAALAAGVSALLIRPTALVGYWPLLGQGQVNPEIDLMSARTLTINGPTPAPHPRIILADPGNSLRLPAAGVPLAGAARFAFATTADLQLIPTSIPLAGAASFAFASSATLHVGANILAGAAGFAFSTSAAMPPAGLSAAATITFATSASLRAGALLSAAASFGFSTTASVVGPAAELSAHAGIEFGSFGNLKARTGRVRILLDGVEGRVRVGSLTIRDILNDAPNTCSLVVDRVGPQVDQTLRVEIETDIPGTGLLFTGTLQTDLTTYEGLPDQNAYPATAIDDTARLNRRLPFGTWTDVAADVIANELRARFAPTFTGNHIAQGLPAIRISFDGSETFIACLTRIAHMIGGYCKVDDNDIYLFLEDEGINPPNPIDADHCFLDDPAISVERDVSQVRTRVYGKGHGEALLSDVLATEQLLPIVDAVMFNPNGGQAIASITSDGATSEILGYDSIELGGSGSLVGPGTSPSAPLNGTPQVGAGLVSGVYKYAYTDQTASGESLPSPLRTVVVSGVLADPGVPLSAAATAGAGIEDGAHSYAYSFVTSDGETRPSPLASVALGPVVAAPTSIGAAFNYVYGAGKLQVNTPYGFAYTFRRTSDGAETSLSPTTSIRTSATGNVGIPIAGCNTPPAGWVRQWYHTPGGGGPFKKDSEVAEVNNWNTEIGGWCYDSDLGPVAPTSNATGVNRVALTNVATGPLGTIARRLWRTKANQSQLLLLSTLADNSTTSADDATPDALLGATAPTVNTSTANQVALSGIAIGPGATTGRKVYRTPVNGSQLKLLATLANNTETTYTDTSADGSLGANAPTSDTSGFAQPAGQVVAGASSIPTAGAGVFGPAGVPGVAPSVSPVAGDGIEAGAHKWAYTWVLPTGESPPSPLASATLQGDPVAGSTFVGSTSNSTTQSMINAAFNPGDVVEFCSTYSDAAVQYDFSRNSVPSPSTPPHTAQLDPAKGAPYTWVIRFTVQHTTDPAAKWVHIWRRVNGGTWRYAGGQANDFTNNVLTYSSNVPASPSPWGDPLPPAAVPTCQATLTNITPGPAGTTARKVYRTVVNGAQLQLQSTIADNVTTAITDHTPDATLGAFPPAAASVSGGWAIIGNGEQVIRYTGILGNTLVGIPPTGPGAIVAAIGYNSTITVAPLLRNVTGLTRALLKGARVHIWVQRDDLVAQAELAASGHSGDGIIEHRLQDERRGEPSLIQLCDADLAQFSRPLVTVRYATHDVKTRSGKTVVVNVEMPPIHETLMIQEVTITEIGIAPNLPPRYSVVASSVRFSLEDMLRQLAISAA